MATDIQKADISIAPCQWKVFLAFFLHVMGYELGKWKIHPVGGRTHQVWVSSQAGHLTHFTSKHRLQIDFTTHGPTNYMSALNLTLTFMQWVVWPLFIFLQLGNFWPWWPKTLGRGNHWLDHLGSLPLESFSDIFSKHFEVSSWKLVFTLSRFYNILSSRFTRIGSLWPTSCV